jgi:hypothetical protein
MRPRQVREQWIEVRCEDRPSGRLQPHLELVMVEAALGVGVGEGRHRLVALGVAEPVGRIRWSGSRPMPDLRWAGVWAGVVVVIAGHCWPAPD